MTRLRPIVPGVLFVTFTRKFTRSPMLQVLCDAVFSTCRVGWFNQVNALSRASVALSALTVAVFSISHPVMESSG